MVEWHRLGGIDITANDYTLEETKGFRKALDHVDYVNYIRSFNWSEPPYDKFIEGIEFDIQTSAFSKSNIHNTERTCVIFAKDKTPIVFALRKDFPREILHVNMMTKDLPVSPCLYEEPYSEIRLWLTWEIFLDSIHKWYKRASDGTAHLPNQAIEPLTLGGKPILVSKSFFDTEKIHYVTDINGILTCGPIDFTNDLPRDAKVLIPIEADPTVSRCIHYAPSNFKELFDLANEIGFSLREKLSEFTRRIEDLLDANIEAGQCSKGVSKGLAATEFQRFSNNLNIPSLGKSNVVSKTLQKLYKQVTNTAIKNRDDVRRTLLLWTPIFWVRLPKKRSKGGGVEWVEDIAFETSKCLGDLCKDLSIYFEQDGYMVHEKTVPTIKTDNQVTIDDTIAVSVVKPVPNLDITMAQKLSGLNKETEKYLAIGAGALGSQVITNLTRLGVGKWDVLDRDILLPHNLSRHALFFRQSGFHKASSLTNHLNMLMDDFDFSRPIVHDFLEYERDIKEYDLIFDFSASTATVRHLAIKTERPAIVSAFMTKNGKYLICLSEGNDKSVRVDDIEYQLACKCIDNEELNPVLEVHEEQEIRYSGACSDITTVLPQDRVAVHSGIMSSYIKQNTDEFKTIISIWELTEDCTVKQNTFNPSKVKLRKVKGWEVRISDEVFKKMMYWRSVKLPLETGGVLIGDFDLHNRIVYIVDIIPSPKDSIEEPYSYIRGFEGLSEKIENIKRISGRRLNYIGEWHAHPNSVTPSRLDKLALEEQASEMALVGLPAIMVIIGDRGKYRISIKQG